MLCYWNLSLYNRLAKRNSSNLTKAIRPPFQCPTKSSPNPSSLLKHPERILRIANRRLKINRPMELLDLILRQRDKNDQSIKSLRYSRIPQKHSKTLKLLERYLFHQFRQIDQCSSKRIHH